MSGSSSRPMSWAQGPTENWCQRQIAPAWEAERGTPQEACRSTCSHQPGTTLTRVCILVPQGDVLPSQERSLHAGSRTCAVASGVTCSCVRLLKVQAAGRDPSSWLRNTLSCSRLGSPPDQASGSSPSKCTRICSRAADALDKDEACHCQRTDAMQNAGCGVQTEHRGSICLGMQDQGGCGAASCGIADL